MSEKLKIPWLRRNTPHRSRWVLYAQWGYEATLCKNGEEAWRLSNANTSQSSITDW
jgi:hypothetical protein